MNTMFALSMSDPNVALNVAVVIGGAYVLLKFWSEVESFLDRRREKPPPAETYQVKGDYATRQELRELKQEITQHLSRQDDFLTRVEAQIAVNNRDAEKRAEELHKRINPVLENTGIVRGQMEAFTQSFDNFTKIITAISSEKK
jgi:hypothetical protein